MRTATIWLAFLTCACGQPVPNAAQDNQAGAATPIVEVASTASPAPSARPSAIAEASETLSEPGDEQEGQSALCWQDYCPCVDPETALDRTICRNAKGGIAMSDDQWSIGAMARDLKRSGDESNRQMDEVMSDMRAQRASTATPSRDRSDEDPYPAEGIE